jgi:Fe-S cluster assembly ATPase SufC
MTTLEIKNLAVAVGGTQILSDVSLTIKSGEVHAVMGPPMILHESIKFMSLAN